jgi:hypothetical protein
MVNGEEGQQLLVNGGTQFEGRPPIASVFLPLTGDQ